MNLFKLLKAITDVFPLRLCIWILAISVRCHILKLDGVASIIDNRPSPWWLCGGPQVTVNKYLLLLQTLKLQPKHCSCLIFKHSTWPRKCGPLFVAPGRDWQRNLPRERHRATNKQTCCEIIILSNRKGSVLYMGSSLHGWIHRKAWKGNVTKYHKVA